MATKEETVTVTKTVTVGVDDVTIKNIVDAQKKVGAPDDARITTGGAPGNAQGVPTQAYGVTFSWTEEV